MEDVKLLPIQAAKLQSNLLKVRHCFYHLSGEISIIGDQNIKIGAKLYFHLFLSFYQKERDERSINESS